MVQFIGFDSCQFSSKLIENEVIGLGSFSVGYDERMPKVNGGGVHGPDREDLLYLV